MGGRDFNGFTRIESRRSFKFVILHQVLQLNTVNSRAAESESESESESVGVGCFARSRSRSRSRQNLPTPTDSGQDLIADSQIANTHYLSIFFCVYFCSGLAG